MTTASFLLSNSMSPEPISKTFSTHLEKKKQFCIFYIVG